MTTAEAFVKKNLDVLIEVNELKQGEIEEIAGWFVEFAQLHVQAALQDVKEELLQKGISPSCSELLNAYPLENIT